MKKKSGKKNANTFLSKRDRRSPGKDPITPNQKNGGNEGGGEMKELIIYEFQVKDTIEALEKSAQLLNCYEKKTCVDRDIIQALGYMKNILKDLRNERVPRD